MTKAREKDTQGKTKQAKVIYFRPPQVQPYPFLVLVRSHKEEFCSPFLSYSEADEYMRQEELVEGQICSMYGIIPEE